MLRTSRREDADEDEGEGGGRGGSQEEGGRKEEEKTGVRSRSKGCYLHVVQKPLLRELTQRPFWHPPLPTNGAFRLPR